MGKGPLKPVVVGGIPFGVGQWKSLWHVVDGDGDSGFRELADDEGFDAVPSSTGQAAADARHVDARFVSGGLYG